MSVAQRYRDVLLDKDAAASTVFEAAKRVLGPAFVTWEPETIWMDLADAGIDIDLENRDKLMACVTLLSTRSFYWDAAVFENTAMAFNDIPSAPEALQEASPAEMSWAVFEAQYFLRREYQEEGEFDYEPAKYAAVSLSRTGFLVAPEMLSFAQEELDRLNRGHRDLKPKVEQRWSTTDKTKLTELKLDETPIDIQIGYLAAVHLYVEERARRLKREIAALG